MFLTQILHESLCFSLCTSKIGLIICPLPTSGFLDDDEQDMDMNAVYKGITSVSTFFFNDERLALAQKGDGKCLSLLLR